MSRAVGQRQGGDRQGCDARGAFQLQRCLPDVYGAVAGKLPPPERPHPPNRPLLLSTLCTTPCLEPFPLETITQPSTTHPPTHLQHDVDDAAREADREGAGVAREQPLRGVQHRHNAVGLRPSERSTRGCKRGVRSVYPGSQAAARSMATSCQPRSCNPPVACSQAGVAGAPETHGQVCAEVGEVAF